MSLLGAVGSALGGIGTDLLSSVGQGFVNEFFDRRQMNYENKLMRSNWNLMNAYNSPSAQMARYKEAGLNPNLIYGQANTTSSIGTPSVTSKGVDFGLRAQIANLKADNENKKAQNSLLGSQTDYVNEQARGVALENALKRLTIKSLTGSDPLGSANPNDPYWYRDAKSFMRLLYDKSFMPSVGRSAVPSADIGPNFFDLMFRRPSLRESVETVKGRNRLYEVDERGRKHYL